MANHWLRGVATFAGGAAAALLASRLLPPIMAQAAGAARGAAGTDPFDSLIADHRIFLEMLSRMERSTSVLGRTQRLLRLKRRIAAHAMAEEDVIYPLLQQSTGDSEARHLYGEHAEIKMLLYALENLPKDSAEWTAKLRALKSLIESHGRQEEEVEFPRLRAVLDERARSKLCGSVSREKALVL